MRNLLPLFDALRTQSLLSEIDGPNALAIPNRSTVNEACIFTLKSMMEWRNRWYFLFKISRSCQAHLLAHTRTMTVIPSSTSLRSSSELHKELLPYPAPQISKAKTYNIRVFTSAAALPQSDAVPRYKQTESLPAGHASYRNESQRISKISGPSQSADTRS